ncbi:MAG: phosphohydrolase [Desulfuromonas sp.]|nr:phosphohydrolase [Desulfuromonas sp.]
MLDNQVDALALLEEFYLPRTIAHDILIPHSQAVANKALAIATRLLASNNPIYAAIDSNFIQQAALLHDIGIFATYAPSLGCYGTQPYLQHGIAGHDILLKYGLERHASVCQNHIGVGLSAKEIREQHLPLPEQDFLPQNIEEQIITYADLFFSKNPDKLHQEKSVAMVRRTLSSYGADKEAIFTNWHQIFAPAE